MEKMIFEYIKLDQVEISELNARKENSEESLSELSDSINKIGLQQPIVVYKKGEKYEVIIGQRRTLACKKLGWTEIPALITPVQTDIDFIIQSFSENIHRLDLNYRDKMNVATILYNKYDKSVAQVAKELGVSQTTIRSYLGYAGVPESIKKLVDDGKLSASTAMRIYQQIPDDEQALKIAEKIVEIPRSEDRNKLIALSRTYPNKSVSELTDIAKKLKYSTVTLNLTPPVAVALSKACDDIQSNPQMIAFEALETWLISKGFLYE